jgi:hypothetical protein
LHAQFFKSLGIFGSKNAREYTGYSWLNGGKNPPKGIFLSIYANLVWKTSFLPRIMVRKSENTENLQNNPNLELKTVDYAELTYKMASFDLYPCFRGRESGELVNNLNVFNAC